MEVRPLPSPPLIRKSMSNSTVKTGNWSIRTLPDGSWEVVTDGNLVMDTWGKVQTTSTTSGPISSKPSTTPPEFDGIEGMKNWGYK